MSQSASNVSSLMALDLCQPQGVMIAPGASQPDSLLLVSCTTAQGLSIMSANIAYTCGLEQIMKYVYALWDIVAATKAVAVLVPAPRAWLAAVNGCTPSPLLYPGHGNIVLYVHLHNLSPRSSLLQRGSVHELLSCRPHGQRHHERHESKSGKQRYHANSRLVSEPLIFVHC